MLLAKGLLAMLAFKRQEVDEETGGMRALFPDR